MDQELKAKWVKALRSDKFTQLTPGGSFWTRHGKHCCLGVLGELVDPEATRANGLRAILENRVGIPDAIIDALVDMNDRDKKSFGEIADYVETAKF